ncbi:protein HBS1 isoform X2 [Anthonomus grandis grandis]|uniref:protein HBS1 isoform X2 n=1 Tax=Anthonomus grandis grandis TaxID=2921223 RepID=UPI0021652F39|nr:protein HBS1 isoform X2 [Anthonomus grandis grandis]
MARHRDIRNMDYEDEYDGYDDIYGHSIDDDYYISPSNRQFIYNRETSRDARLEPADDIPEVDTIDELSDTDRVRLESCLDEIKNTLGPSKVSRGELINLVLRHNYNVELVINAILEDPKYQNKIGDKEKVPFMPPSTVVEPVPPPTKVVASTATATNVVKGFNVPQKDEETSVKRAETPQKVFDLKLIATPRSPSPASGRGTPVSAPGEGDEPKGRREQKVDPEAQFKKERGHGKENLYMVVIGHVDAGKSTLMGRLLYELGQVNKKTMHKYEQDSKKVGKQSFMYAWVLDETGEERNRGITMDVGRHLFETKTKHVTLLDAPGHKDFIPNMISGAAQADVGLLVVDATRGEFETGFDLGGQTREHALLVRSLGVTQLAVAINKLDTVSWSKERFDEIVQKLKSFLKQAGFKENDVTFVPCSGLTGQNLIKPPTENELLEWYSGPCLIEVIDKFRSPLRPVSRPFRFTVNDVFKSTGSGFCVDGRVETGVVNIGDKVMVCPSRDQAVVKSLAIDESPKTIAFAGDQATITLSGIEIQNVSIGNILCDPNQPIPVASKFEARIVVFNVAIPITKGYSVVLHHQSLVEPAVISKLMLQLNKSTGEVQKKHPRFLGKNSSAIVEITVSKPIALEVYSECKELGRVMLRVGGVTIAAGLITRIIL